MGATWSKLGFFRLLRAVVFWRVRSPLLVHTQWQVEQKLEFLWVSGAGRAREMGLQDNSGCATVFSRRVYAFCDALDFFDV